MGVEDIKYLWPEYKSGNTHLEEGLSPADFQGIMSEYLSNQYDEAYVIEAPTHKGRFPVGIVFANYMGIFLSPVGATWFSWASNRNKIEGMIEFINEMRKDSLLLGYCTESDKKFFEYIARHGIIRRVGKISGIYEHEDAPLFQSRSF